MGEEEQLIEAKRWHAEKRIVETVAAIQKNNMEGVYAKDRQAACEEIFKRIPAKASVAHGGSYTLKELGIIERLSKGPYNYLRREPPANEAAEHEQRIRSFSADVFLASANAITKTGEIIAVDEFGNRVACLLYGPRKLLIVAGKNKIVDTIEDGMKRIKEYVAPLHVKRRGWDLPCAKTGTCVDCKDPRRICNKWIILERESSKDRTTVILVGEDLGI